MEQSHRDYGVFDMKPSGIITLTTDFGLSDPYVAMMKGVILSINPEARIVDISHSIKVGSVFQAAALIKEAYSYFSKGTIHVGVVDPGVGSDRRLVGIEMDGHFFLGPDNGIFWPLIKDLKTVKIVQLVENKYFLPSVSHTFHGREIFAPVAAHISRGVKLDQMGPELTEPVPINIPKPEISGDFLYGQVVRVDHFGNLITNIHRDELADFLGVSQPVVESGKLSIKGLCKIYSDKEEGKPLALINSSNKLEIAVNLGRAFEYIGIDRREIFGAAVKVGKF